MAARQAPGREEGAAEPAWSLGQAAWRLYQATRSGTSQKPSPGDPNTHALGSSALHLCAVRPRAWRWVREGRWQRGPSRAQVRQPGPGASSGQVHREEAPRPPLASMGGVQAKRGTERTLFNRNPCTALLFAGFWNPLRRERPHPPAGSSTRRSRGKAAPSHEGAEHSAFRPRDEALVAWGGGGRWGGALCVGPGARGASPQTPWA